MKMLRWEKKTSWCLEVAQCLHSEQNRLREDMSISVHFCSVNNFHDGYNVINAGGGGRGGGKRRGR